MRRLGRSTKAKKIYKQANSDLHRMSMDSALARIASDPNTIFTTANSSDQKESIPIS